MQSTPGSPTMQSASSSMLSSFESLAMSDTPRADAGSVNQPAPDSISPLAGRTPTTSVTRQAPRTPNPDAEVLESSSDDEFELVSSQSHTVSELASSISVLASSVSDLATVDITSGDAPEQLPGAGETLIRAQDTPDLVDSNANLCMPSAAIAPAARPVPPPIPASVAAPPPTAAIPTTSSASSDAASSRVGHVRRAGRRARRRREGCDEASVADRSERTSSIGSSFDLVSEYSEDGMSDFEDLESVSEFGSEASAPTGSAVPHLRSHTPSVMSAEDAESSIDDFLIDDRFMSDKANKLRLWQALCIEPDLPSYATSDDDEDTGTCSSRSVTPTDRAATPRPTLPPLPMSLTQAKELLGTKGHVNLVDYLAARKARLQSAGPIMAGGIRVRDPPRAGQYVDLVYPSASALLRDLRRTGKFVSLDKAKMEWLNPLLRDFGMKRSRAAMP